MRKIFLICSLVFVYVFATAQYPSIQQLGNNPKTLVVTNAIKPADGFIQGIYSDTTAANSASTYFGTYNGASIVTYSGGVKWWVRYNGRWYEMSGGGGGGSTNTSVGNGFKVAIDNTNNIKSLTAGLWLNADSATSNQVNYKADSASISTYLVRRKDSTITFATPTQLNTKQNTLTLTTIGSSGVSALTGATLNIPDYSLLQTGIGNFYDSVANVLDPIYGGGDGSALRLQGAVASGKSVFIPYGTVMNIHDTTIQLQNYQKLFGGGEIYSATVGTVAYAGMFNMVKTGKYNTIDGITFRGAGKGTFITTDYYTPQNGIQITDSANLITNCIFFGIKGAGVLGMYYTGSFQNLDNNIINNCRFESNTVGVYNFLGGNYQIITGCTMIQNYIGVAQQTANAKIVSTSLNYNHIGIIGEGGPADRGQITGCSINHNDTALILKNTSYGYLITGTTFFWGHIYLKDADKTVFSNCIIATNAGVKVDGSGIINKNVMFLGGEESNSNTWTEVGTGKIIRAGVMVDNLTRFDISKTLYLRDSAFIPYIYAQSASSSDSVMVKDATTGQVKLKAQSAFGGTNIYNSDGTLSGSRVLTGAGFDLDFVNVPNFSVSGRGAKNISYGGVLDSVTTLVAQLNLSGLYASKNTNSIRSEINVYYDSITIKPHQGNLFVDTIALGYGSKILRWNPSTGKITYVDTVADFTLTNGSHYLPDSLLVPVSTNSLKVRSLQAGSGITLSSNDSSVIITASGGAGMAIGGTITSATSGSILYAGTNGLLQQSNSYFFYDSTNRRFYVGLNSGTGTLNLRAPSGNTDFKLTDGSGTETWGAAATTAGDFAFFHSGATPFKIERFATDNALYINSSGKVGFNTASPDSTVTINGGLRINNGAAQVGYVWTALNADGRGTWQAATGGGLSSSNFVFNEVPSGTINGVNTTFTLANTPTAGTVAIFLRGLRMKLTTDYTISGSTITMINIPDTGDDLVADYLK